MAAASERNENELVSSSGVSISWLSSKARKVPPPSGLRRTTATKTTSAASTPAGAKNRGHQPEAPPFSGARKKAVTSLFQSSTASAGQSLYIPVLQIRAKSARSGARRTTWPTLHQSVGGVRPAQAAPWDSALPRAFVARPRPIPRPSAQLTLPAIAFASATGRGRD